MYQDEDAMPQLTSGGRARSLGFMTIIVVSSSSVSMNSARPFRSEKEKGKVRCEEEEGRKGEG
jgi:hypothetical protein